MATPFSFQLTLLFNQRIDDLGGNWQYAAANGVELTTTGQTTGQKVQLIATKRENANCCNSFPASILTAVVMFPLPEKSTAVPENITLQGIHDLTSNSETGSVSAASPQYADFIGGNFTFDGATGILKISPRA